MKKLLLVLIYLLLSINIGICQETQSSEIEPNEHTLTTMEQLEKAKPFVLYWLNQQLKDPDSLIVEGWNADHVGEDLRVLCKYRAKNSYGGYSRSLFNFILVEKDNGYIITKVIDVYAELESKAQYDKKIREFEEYIKKR